MGAETIHGKRVSASVRVWGFEGACCNPQGLFKCCDREGESSARWMGEKEQDSKDGDPLPGHRGGGIQGAARSGNHFGHVGTSVNVHKWSTLLMR